MTQDYTGVRPETLVRTIDGHAQGEHGKSSKSYGLVKAYATADLPAASSLPNGTLVIDSTAVKLMVVIAGAYKSVTLT